MHLKPKTHKFVVRLPMQLRDRIADAAKYYRRSMNSEIVARLEQSFSGLPNIGNQDNLAPEMHETLEKFFAGSMSTDEEAIIRAYRRLPMDKKTALLDLIS